MRDGAAYGLPSSRSKFGYLCVEAMMLRVEDAVDPETGEIAGDTLAVLPTHYKCSHTGACLPVENPSIWVYPGEAE